MIEFFSENDFQLSNAEKISSWISSVIASEGFVPGEISFIFCSDPYLHKLNKQFLNHDTFTDIITFDNSMDKELHGEIYISTDRVKENSLEWKESFENEMNRVLIHGILHLMGYKDSTSDEKQKMRQKEDACLLLINS